MDQDVGMLDLDDGSQPSSPVSAEERRSSQVERMDCFPTKEERRFKVSKWSAIALWAYDIAVDNCAICRNHIMDKCIECQAFLETTNIDGNCSIAWGKCSHVFHSHCITKWLDRRQVCPLDNRDWEFQTLGPR